MTWPDLIGAIRDPKKANRNLCLVVLFVFILWLAVFGVWLCYAVTKSNHRFDPERAGQFGDFFGSVNALFTGLALAGVAYAVLLQHQELDAAKEQLQLARAEAKGGEEARRKSEEAMAKQIESMRVAAMLTAADAIATSSIDLYGSQEFDAWSLTYGAAQMDRTDPGSRHTARQATIAAASSAS